MDNIKQYVIDFIEGRVKASEFIGNCETNPEILNWIQSIIPIDKYYETSEFHVENGKIINTRKKIPYRINEVWESLKFPAYGSLGIKNNIHSTITRIVKEAYPNEIINVDTSLNEKSNFILSVCPNYICGGKASDLVEKIIDENPNDSKKSIKNRIKEAFYLDGNKYPRWAQDSEWPFSETGKPMKYISQRNKNSETIELIFEDVDTGKRITIEDIY